MSPGRCRHVAAGRPLRTIDSTSNRWHCNASRHASKRRQPTICLSLPLFVRHALCKVHCPSLHCSHTALLRCYNRLDTKCAMRCCHAGQGRQRITRTPSWRRCLHGGAQKRRAVGRQLQGADAQQHSAGSASSLLLSAAKIRSALCQVTGEGLPWHASPALFLVLAAGQELQAPHIAASEAMRCLLHPAAGNSALADSNGCFRGARGWCPLQPLTARQEGCSSPRSPSRKPFLKRRCTLRRCLVRPVPVVLRRMAFTLQLSAARQTGTREQSGLAHLS